MTSSAAIEPTEREAPLERQLEEFRRELTGYCYRMLGSAFEAEDAVQETMIRAWRGHRGFEGRAALRSWVYRIATNVCMDALNGRQRRARPMDLTSSATVSTASGTQLPEVTWIGPVPDTLLTADPAELTTRRESVRLAFVAALQRLAPKQRAVLILREVLAWSAAEVAELLGVTVASVNSALQRARSTMAAQEPVVTDPLRPLDQDQERLLERYLRAFESYDLDTLAGLLHEDAVLSMPPYEMWLRGKGEIRDWLLGPGCGCRGSRLLPTVANGAPAFGQYRPSPDGGHAPWALQVLEISAGRVVGLNSFLDTEQLFPLFGLPARLDG
ncbi:RNA polymerase sigma-70 factor (ECF subfamily) [Kitasatospora gansuensis]|uniref:RNA polymerase sigma-70 factor (ECF subfamily) n=1 Tax=Kitasatospora gansuensis TaxID=258050 RepID=A0A7W7SD13_9ACTN|nr:sigma-70 family RNA polymerase sigma factor [Kitasatospora gansuensis]MBB4948249.1 RNA polymerase sigma-70 factor (ECF subfamily) [Kitasatospora gansuensis]